MSVRKQTDTVVLTAGGDKTFTALTRGIGSQRTYGIQLVAGTLTTTPVTVTMQISYDGTNFVTMTDNDDTDITFTVASAGTPVLSLVDIPYEALVRPSFTTDSTGSIVVTIFA